MQMHLKDCTWEVLKSESETKNYIDVQKKVKIPLL